MASEVGQGYVSIIPSARGFASRLQRDIGSDLTRAGKKGGQDYAKGFEQEAVDGAEDASSGMSDKLKVGLAAGGALAGAALVAGVGEALDRGRLEDKLAAQLGGGPKTQRATRAAADLFNGAWGESVEDVNNAVASVVTNIGGMRRASAKDLKAVTASVLDVATAFDQDASAITRASDQLIRTNLAKGPREALDIITKGFQTGANEADDLLDTYSEYGTQFRKLGLDGAEATGLLSQGLRAGARDADVVADALKEFSIRSVEALTEVDSKGRPQMTELGHAFEAVGVEVLTARGEVSRAGQAFQQDLAAGGDRARGALEQVLDRLRNIDNPLERSRAAVALFGTQAEDTGDALFALDPSKAVDTLGKVGGAAKRMGKTLNDNAATELESFKRQMQSRFVDFLGNNVIPAAQSLWKDVGPDVKRFGRSLGDAAEDIGPMVKDVLPVAADVLGDVAKAFGGFAKAFTSLPKPLQTAIITAAVAGYGVSKLRGGGFMPPIVPVGAGAGGAGGAGGIGAAGAGAAASRGARFATKARRFGIAGLAAFTGYEVVSGIQNLGQEAPKIDALGTALRNMGTFGAGKLPEDMEDLGDTVERMTSQNWAHRLERAAGSYDEEEEEVRHLDDALTRLAKDRGLPAAEKAFRQMARSEDLSREETRALISILPNYKRLVDNSSDATGKHAKRLEGAREAGWDLLGLWRRNLLPTTGDLADKFGLTTREAGLLRGKLGDTTGTAKQHEKQLRQVAKQLGLNREETNDLIKKYGDIPKKVETRAEFLTNQAERERDNFLEQTKGKFRKLGDTTYAIMVDGRSGHGRLFEADGGIVRFADGGHFAQIAKPGTTRIWNEPETGGESYIPLHPSKRKRSLGIWAETGRHLGVEGFADGGIAGRMRTKINLDMSEAAEAVRELVKVLRASGGSVPATLAWARKQVGKSYGWGAVGPGSYDCSGFMSAITNHLMGRTPFSRLFATGSFPTSMFARGTGTFSIGSFRGSPGHMAGTLGGVNVESSGGVGVRVGGGARGATDPMFGGNIWHLKPGLIRRVVTGGGSDAPGGDQGPLNRFERYIVGRESGGRTTANNPNSTAFGLGQLISGNRVAYARRLGLPWRREAGDTGSTNRAAQLAMMRMYIDDRYGSARSAYNFHVNHGWYDRGGVLKPGWTAAYNGTGRDEYITRDRPQTRRGPVRVELDLGEGLRLRGFIRGIARDEVDGSSDLDATTGRMR